MPEWLGIELGDDAVTLAVVSRTKSVVVVNAFERKAYPPGAVRPGGAGGLRRRDRRLEPVRAPADSAFHPRRRPLPEAADGAFQKARADREDAEVRTGGSAPLRRRLGSDRLRRGGRERREHETARGGPAGGGAFADYGAVRTGEPPARDRDIRGAFGVRSRRDWSARATTRSSISAVPTGGCRCAREAGSFSRAPRLPPPRGRAWRRR